MLVRIVDQLRSVALRQSMMSEYSAPPQPRARCGASLSDATDVQRVSTLRLREWSSAPITLQIPRCNLLPHALVAPGLGFGSALTCARPVAIANTHG